MKVCLHELKDNEDVLEALLVRWQQYVLDLNYVCRATGGIAACAQHAHRHVHHGSHNVTTSEKLSVQNTSNKW